MTPIAQAPSQVGLDRALASATAAVLVGDDDLLVRVRGDDLRALREALRIQEGTRSAGWEPQARVTLELSRHQRPIARVEVSGRADVHMPSWRGAAPAASPEALASWLSAHGAGALTRALERARGDTPARALATWQAAAPPELRGFADALADDPSGARRVSQAAVAARAARGLAGAAWALAAWHGAVPGAWREGYSFESVSRSALQALGVHAIIGEAAAGVPERARVGVARLLVEEVTSRGWGLAERLPEAVRVSLVEAARTTGVVENATRAARLLLGEGELAPPGSELVAAAQAGSFRRLCTDGARAFAVDGNDLVRLERGRGATKIAKLFKGDTPLAVREDQVFFLQPGGVERLRTEGDEVRKGRRPLFGLPARRLPGMLDRFARERDARLPEGDLLVLDADADACDAYEAFGGEEPAALRLRSAYACDVERGVLLEARRGASREVTVGGRPAWISARETGVLVVVEREGMAQVIAVDEGGPARELGAVRARADEVMGALLVGGRAWLRLWAPLGDVVVAISGALSGERTRRSRS